ncbi:MAG TPA: type I glyceraldehyde-3-phosphate dehydrogenase [Bacteroidales bacterium]|nr:type I glyceraldehyde-3-phosphate dehydrogenase [Bacteroidales bacterium]
MIRIAINGFGRIGRVTLRNAFRAEDMEVVAVNDLADAATLAHLLRYDSVQGRFPAEVSHTAERLTVGEREVLVFSEPDPGKLPWKALGIDVVIESTGLFLTREAASAHLSAGARKVIISAPAKGEPDGIEFVVLGVNDHVIRKEDRIISNASCTTNCVAPLIKVLDDLWGVEKGFITTVHSYTRDQNLMDGPHSKDLRRARAAAVSIIPTTTGAAKASTHIFPHLKNNLGGAGIRVPVPDGSLTDLTCTLRHSTSVTEINAAFRKAAEGPMKGILEYTEDPIVSVDVIGNTHSAIFDAGLTAVLGDKNKLVKVVAWYDNEMGYSARLVELVRRFA